MATTPFTLDDALTAEVHQLGAAVYAFIDAVQELYAAGDPTIRAYLDPGTPADLLGLELDRQIVTFRLDLVIENGHPVITEVEEIYGNAGKAYAMQQAYGLDRGVDYRALFRAFAAAGVTHVLVDDQVTTYDSELELLRQALAKDHAHPIVVQHFADADLGAVGTAWRFCYTTDLAQYPTELRRRITRTGIRYVNPLFHGYGTKTLLALIWAPQVQNALTHAIGADALAVLRCGTAETRTLDPEEGIDLAELAAHRRSRVVKVSDSPADRSMTWGSRGVFFGESSAARWAAVLAGVRSGHLPGRPTHPARYVTARLIDSDRFDVAYLHPDGDRLSTMHQARIRLAPIFWRTGGHIDLVAGHATFVNTSRKIHLGRHAVCAPIRWEADPK